MRVLASPPTEDQAESKFEARLRAAALELIARAEILAPTSEARERTRLTDLLGRDGDLVSLNSDLCARIRDGALTLASPGLASHLRATTMEKLAIDQPTYAAYRLAVEQSKE
jgi:hypothetical protein